MFYHFVTVRLKKVLKTAWYEDLDQAAVQDVALAKKIEARLLDSDGGALAPIGVSFAKPSQLSREALMSEATPSTSDYGI